MHNYGTSLCVFYDLNLALLLPIIQPYQSCERLFGGHNLLIEKHCSSLYLCSWQLKGAELNWYAVIVSIPELYC